MDNRDRLLMKVSSEYKGEPQTVRGYIEDGIAYSAERPDDYIAIPYTFFIWEKAEYLAELPTGTPVYRW